MVVGYDVGEAVGVQLGLHLGSGNVVRQEGMEMGRVVDDFVFGGADLVTAVAQVVGDGAQGVDGVAGQLAGAVTGVAGWDEAAGVGVGPVPVV